MTIEYYPAALASAHDDLIFTVSDSHTADPVTYQNYKFIADIYVNGIMVARMKKVPNPDTLIGVFNVGQAVRSYLTQTFNPGATMQAQELGRGEFYIDLQVKFGEEYDYTSYYNLATSTSQKVYNNYNRRLFGTDSSLEGLTDKLITNMPLSTEVFLNQEYSFITYFPTSTSAVTVDIQPDNGSVLNASVTPSTAYFAQVINVSPAVINGLSASKINTGTSYYDVTIGGITTRFYIGCSGYDVYELHWLNQYGGYDTKLFTKVSRKTANIQRSSFGVLPYAVDSNGAVTWVNSNNVYNETVHNYANQFTEKLIVNSDLLTDEEYTWLYDLMVSTEVYVNINGYFYSCTITDNNYEQKRRVNDSLTNLTLTLDFGKTLNAQYR